MSSLINFQREANTRLTNWMDKMWSDFDKEISRVFNGGSTISKMGYPRVDVSETDTYLMIEASLPGMTQKDVSVEYADGHLVISGSSLSRREDARYHYKELHKSQFTRSFVLPENVFDIESIDAKLENGLLTVKINKREEAVVRENIRTIEVK